MTIIRFPGEDGPKRPKVDPGHKFHVGGLSFTCTCCQTPSEINFKKMLFRSVDFYCAECGTYFKVTNPAFTPPVSRGPRKC